MRALITQWTERVQSLPKRQRYALIAVIWVAAVAAVTVLHGFVAALLSSTTALGLGYLLSQHGGNPREFIDFKRPALHHIRFAAGGVTAILAVEVGLGILWSALGPTSDVARHSITTTTAAQPGPGTIALLFVVVVIAGPFVEELVFRNGIQKLLMIRYNAPLAIGVTSAVFATLHVPSYGGFGASAASLALPLSAIFISSCVFGYVYWRTENVVTAMITHGGMNALALVVALT